MIQNRSRTAIAALALSAAGLVGILSNEGYTDHAVIPVPGDKPLFTRNRRKRSLQRPTALESCMNALRRCAEFFRPRGHAFALTKALEKNAVSFVSSLLGRSGPSTVLGGVVPVCVDSVNGRADRTCFHISKKVREFSPTRAHRDAPPSIGSKVFVAYVEAPPEHVGPRFVLSSCSASVGVRRVPMSITSLAGSLALQATTRLRMTATELVGTYNHFRAAVTAAKPRSSSSNILRLCDYLKPVKPLFGKVDEIRHGGFLLRGVRCD